VALAITALVCLFSGFVLGMVVAGDPPSEETRRRDLEHW
jgi:hypothetical protein